MGVFDWLRTSVRDAVLGGFSDAARALTEADDVPALLLGPADNDHEDEPAGALPAPKRNGKAKGVTA